MSKPVPIKYGTKKELIEFINTITRVNWLVKKIGVAETSNAQIIYQDLNSKNIQRQDYLGEFLNRPMFILQSKRLKQS